MAIRPHALHGWIVTSQRRDNSWKRDQHEAGSVRRIAGCRRQGLRPAEFGERLPPRHALDGGSHVRNGVVGQLGHVGPEQFAALVRLRILDLAAPSIALEKEVHPLLPTVLSTMHDMGEAEIAGFGLDTEFLTKLSARGVSDALSAVEVPGRDAQIPVLVTRVRSTKQQERIARRHEDVDRRSQTKAPWHHRRLQTRLGQIDGRGPSAAAKARGDLRTALPSARMAESAKSDTAASEFDLPLYALAAVVYVERDDQILLMKRAEGTALAGQWFLPGGAIEHGELPEAGARRELREEAGIEIEGELELIGAYPMVMYGHEMLQLSYRGRAAAGAEVTVSHEHDDAQWVRPRDMQVLLSDEFIDELAGGDEGVRSFVRNIAADLDTYIQRVS